MADGRRAFLVTGASRNLGRACAVALAGAGANVAVSARSDSAGAEETAALCEALGARTVVALGDLRRAADVDAVVGEAEAALGPLSGYVANAAVRPRSSFLDLDPMAWQDVLDLDLSAAFLLARRTVPGMVAGGWGRIVHTSGLSAWRGASDEAHVVAAKAGLHGLTRSLAVELGEHGITVNTVVPAAFDTDRGDDEEMRQRLEAMRVTIPVGRLGRPEEYGSLCTYLMSDSAGFLTGQALHLNGGLWPT